MKLRKRFVSAILAGIMVLSLSLSPALAAGFNPVVDTITSSSDSRISAMVNAIGLQSFSSPTAEKVESLISYFIHDSKYAAVGGSAWPYTNENGYVSTVTDGTYTISGINGSGCFAYSKFVMNVVYGKTGEVLYEGESAGAITAAGLATFLRTYAQAGEQIRLGNIHSVTFISCTSDGFYYMDYWGGYIKLHYTTFAKFASACNSSTSSVKLCIYNANTNANDPSKQNGGTTDPGTGTTSTLTITPTAYPASQMVAGSYCNLKGTITSNYSITSIKGVIYSSTGTAVQTQTASPYSTSVNIQSTAINKLSFGKLSVGEYYLEYTAADKSGKTVVWTSDMFSVVSSVSTLTISPDSYPTGSLSAKAFTLTGTVSSNYTLNTVIGSINSATGDTLYTAMVRDIDSTTFSISNSGIDNALPFGKLTEGNYYLVYEASDKSGNTAVWTSPIFTIVADTVVEPADATGTFADVSASAWYFSYVERMAKEKLISGVQVGENKYYFYPDRNMTRSQAVVILYQLYVREHGTPTITATNPYTDVAAGSWYETAILWAYENNIVGGTSETTFGVNDSITRQQIARIFYAYAVKYAGATAPTTDHLASYTDGDSVASWARESVNWCIEKGIFSSVSTDTKTFSPTSPATRSQCARLFCAVEDALNSALSIKPESYPTGSMEAQSFTLTGTVSSNYALTAVTGTIYSSAGEMQYTATASDIGSTTFSIANSSIDQSLSFDKLEKGSYYLVYEATDASGKSATWTSEVFTIIGGATTDPSNATGTFPDVAASAWYYNAVEDLAQAKIISGVQVDENTYYFYPGNKVTRSQAVMMLYKLYCWSHTTPTVSGTHPFEDVAADSWYETAVCWAYESGLVAGTSATTFSPEANITRQEMAQIIYAYGLKFCGGVDTDTDLLSAYTDGADVADWAKKSVNWCIEKGIYSSVSTTEKTFAPRNSASRAECAQLFYKVKTVLS